ncbi:hypothetical protein [Streptomyces sp. NPDC026673]|uniref:hypothetical protein n=1 Tax=Streptomyces sp. NPDC026673 TaxID=3155724 RepID=UPI0033EB1E0D
MTATVATRQAFWGDGELDLPLPSAHRPGDAERLVSGIAGALRECRSFAMTDGEGPTRYFAVRPAKAPAAGDEAIAYVLTGTGDGRSGTATVTGVRPAASSSAAAVPRSPSGPGGAPTTASPSPPRRARPSTRSVLHPTCPRGLYVTVKPSGDPGGPPVAVVRAQHGELAAAAAHP